MRRRLVLIAACLALTAVPASGQDRGRITVMSQPATTTLRPSQTVDPNADMPGLGRRTAPVPPAFGAPPKTAGERRAEQQRLSSTPPLPVLSPPPLRSRADPGQCRTACAQTYYFCASGDSAEDCSTGWAQCRAGCEPAAGWRAPIGLRGG